jgi:hypothetical protein
MTKPMKDQEVKDTITQLITANQVKAVSFDINEVTLILNGGKEIVFIAESQGYDGCTLNASIYETVRKQVGEVDLD